MDDEPNKLYVIVTDGVQTDSDPSTRHRNGVYQLTFLKVICALSI